MYRWLQNPPTRSETESCRSKGTLHLQENMFLARISSSTNLIPIFHDMPLSSLSTSSSAPTSVKSQKYAWSFVVKFNNSSFSVFTKFFARLDVFVVANLFMVTSYTLLVLLRQPIICLSLQVTTLAIFLSPSPKFPQANFIWNMTDIVFNRFRSVEMVIISKVFNYQLCRRQNVKVSSDAFWL